MREMTASSMRKRDNLVVVHIGLASKMLTQGPKGVLLVQKHSPSLIPLGMHFISGK